jgi:histidinol-phosphate phosphatase family protein
MNPAPPAMKLVFLDRDGVINRFPGKGVYVVREEDFHFIPGALQGLRLLTEAGYELHVVSNQGCVSRGLLSMEELNRMTGRMLDRIRREGGEIRQVYYCVHRTSDACGCKKPKTELLEKALAGRRVTKTGVFFIGDSEEDMAAGKNIGCRTVLVLSGRTGNEDIAKFASKPDAVRKDLLDAAKWLLKKRS